MKQVMSKRTKLLVKFWVGATAILAGAATALSSTTLAASTPEILALGVLGVCAAIAHRFPIASPFQAASFRLTHVFVVAGAVVLPPYLLTPLVLLAISPDLWFRRHRPRVLFGWVFNVAQTSLSAHAAALWIAMAGHPRLTSPLDLLILLSGAALFSLIQEALVAVVVALDTQTPLRRSTLFSQPALISNGLTGILAVAVADLWLANPLLLVLVVPVLVLAYKLTRSAHLAQLSQVDPKTGLPNSQHFERAVELELRHSRRLGKPLAVLFADLDRFKRINDTYGHGVGDLVLQTAANRLTAAVRRGDLVARFGGEEFVILLPSADVHEALYVAERVRSAMHTEPFIVEGGVPLHCTISVGVAVSPEHGTEVAALVQQADTAMYEAKQTRDAVALARATGPAAPELARLAENPPQSEAQLAVPAAPGRLATLALWATIVAGLVVTIGSAAGEYLRGDWADLLPLLVLSAVAELFAVQVQDADDHQISFSFGVVPTMAAVVANPIGAPLVNFASGLVHVVRGRPRNASKALFNLANLPLAAAAATWVHAAILPFEPRVLDAPLVSTVLAAVAYYGVNMGTIALMVSLHTRRRLTGVLGESLWFTPTKLFFALTGAFLGAAHDRLGTIGTAMFVAPLLILRFTLSLYASRSRRAIERLRALNSQLGSEITRRQRSEERLEYQARHDSLTGLGNRLLLREHLESTTRHPVACGWSQTLLLLDVDHFRDINDTFGHEYGDDLLRLIGTRLSEALREGDTIVRLGGDEFAALLPGVASDEAMSIARQLQRAMRRPFVVDGHRLEVGASIGIAIYPDHGRDTETLLRRADVAMYAAKRERTGCNQYTPAQDHYSPERLELVSELRQAIDDRTLVLHYQPKVFPDSGRLHSVEALVRWPHARHGLILPDEFIPIAEQTGLIKSLTRFVLESALRDCQSWRMAGHEIPIAVNVSTHDLRDNALPERVSELLAVWDVPARLLRLEITEGAIMADPGGALEVLDRLRALGVGVSIDDYGTGYASLAYLTRLPVDELKIDRSFVRHMVSEAKQRAIVRSTVELGHDLGLTVVAEGVEDHATWDLLRQVGCDVIQGYAISRPLPTAALVRWLAESEPRPSDLKRAA